MNPVGFLDFGVKDAIEIILIAGVLFYLYRWIKGTFAIQAAVGLVLVILVNALVSLLGLSTLNFILKGILDVGVLAVIIIFQPEIRRLLYNLGQNRALDRLLTRNYTESVIDEVTDAVKTFSQTRTGALIVFSLGPTLQDMVDEGIRMESIVSAELLQSIFQKESSLHDGAVIIRGNRIVAARAILPSSRNPNLGSNLGTRHRAAAGITENNQAFAVVVSEETGKISMSMEGDLVTGYAPQSLKAKLKELLKDTRTKAEVVDFVPITSEKETV